MANRLRLVRLVSKRSVAQAQAICSKAEGMASGHDQSIRVTSADLPACEDSPHDEPSRLSGWPTVP